MSSSRFMAGRIGLVVNPRAGQGEATVADVARRLLIKLANRTWVLVDGTQEARIARDLGIAVDLVPGFTDPMDARTSTHLLLSAGVSGIVGVGGDGTLCDIASSLCAERSDAWLFGIGAGSSNVGPLVGTAGTQLEALNVDSLEEMSVHAIEALRGEAPIGIAFHDVAIANTYFGTRDGKRVDLDASAALAGTDRLASPVSVCGTGTWIKKNGRVLVDNQDRQIRQIVASPINNPVAYAGMAISGLMCWGPYVEQHAVLTAASAVMIRTRLALQDILDAEPMRLIQVSFGTQDRLDLGGFESDAVVVTDGNPMHRLDSRDVITLRLRSRAVRTLRPARQRPKENP